MSQRQRTRNQDGPAVNWEYKVYELAAACNQQSTTPVLTDTVSGTCIEYQDSTVMTDVVTSDFWKKVSQGEIINNPMTSIQTKYTDKVALFKSDMAGRKWDVGCTPDGWKYWEWLTEGTRPSSQVLGDETALPSLPAYDPADDIAIAVNKAYANIDTNEVQSLVMAAEGEKTIVSLVAIFKRLIRLVKTVKRLDVHGVLFELTPKQLADRYMEVRYALRPLMYDARGTLNALQTEAVEIARRQTFRGNSHFTDSSFSNEEQLYTINNSSTYGTWRCTWKEVQKMEYHTFVRAGVLTQLMQLNALNIWGLTQPVESIWELVPFSFIVDWFINVGDTISAWTPNYGTRALASWYVIETVTHQSKKWIECDSFMPGGTSIYEPLVYDWYYRNCEIGKETITKTRVPNPRRTIVPTFNVRLNGFKLADLVIIAKQLLASGK